MKKKEKIKYIFIAIVILATGLIYSFFLSEKDINNSSVVLDENVSQDGTENEISGSKIYVYVCGCVVSPGVYELEQGERVFNAIEKAGGITNEGNTNDINLADVLEDGQKIQINSINQVALGEERDGLVNINTATLNSLMDLPGIGTTKAQGIISYRENNGLFNSVEDIMLVEGIKETLFSKIKDLIKV